MLEARIATVTDDSGSEIKNTQLQHPLRITVRKSPVIINYRLFQVGVSPAAFSDELIVSCIISFHFLPYQLLL